MMTEIDKGTDMLPVVKKIAFCTGITLTGRNEQNMAFCWKTWKQQIKTILVYTYSSANILS